MDSVICNLPLLKKINTGIVWNKLYQCDYKIEKIRIYNIATTLILNINWVFIYLYHNAKPHRSS